MARSKKPGDKGWRSTVEYRRSDPRVRLNCNGWAIVTYPHDPDAIYIIHEPSAAWEFYQHCQANGIPDEIYYKSLNPTLVRDRWAIEQRDRETLIKWRQAERRGVRYPIPLSQAWEPIGLDSSESAIACLGHLSEGGHYVQISVREGRRKSVEHRLNLAGLERLCRVAGTRRSREFARLHFGSVAT